MQTISGRQHIEMRCNKYNRRATDFAYAAGLTLATAMCLAFLVGFRGQSWWFTVLVFGLFAIHFFCLAVSRTFADKAQRVRKTLDSYRT